jgi:hypothetical protein
VKVHGAKNNEAHGARNNERHGCARRRVGEPAVFLTTRRRKSVRLAHGRETVSAQGLAPFVDAAEVHGVTNK